MVDRWTNRVFRKASLVVLTLLCAALLIAPAVGCRPATPSQPEEGQAPSGDSGGTDGTTSGESGGTAAGEVG